MGQKAKVFLYICLKFTFCSIQNSVKIQFTMKSNAEHLKDIESYIAQIPIHFEPDRLYAPIRYTLAEGGKRLRPMLTMLAHQIYTDNTSHALPAAAAVEVFHNFTLLHDDIMDNADMRRGKPSVHVKWNQNIAILSGDVMMILAYKLLSQTVTKELPRILDIFNNMATQVCEGQQYDMDYETQPKVAVVEYMNMIELKTSVLLGGATLIGAIVGGAAPEHQPILQKFATELGLAFQLQDDLLDTYGDETLGKPIGGDILEGKQTFLKIMAISRADQPQRKVLNTTHQSVDLTNKQKIKKIKDLYNKLEIRHITELQIKTKFDRALMLLDSLVDMGVDRVRIEPLREYAMSLMDRKK